MIRRRNSTALSRPGEPGQDDVDPSSSLVNLADCMLVMVVGLLVALVAHYGVDLQQDEQQLSGLEVVVDEDGDGEVDEGSFEEAGTVYRDKDSGSYYIVRK